jgi:hypothetical protein
MLRLLRGIQSAPTAGDVAPRRPHQRDEALHRLAQGETQADIARTFNVDPATICRLAAASPFEHGAVVAQ